MYLYNLYVPLSRALAATIHSIINAAEELSQRRIKHLDVLPRPGIVDVLSSLCNACLLKKLPYMFAMVSILLTPTLRGRDWSA